MVRRARLAFEGCAESVPTARHFAVRTAKEWGFCGLREDIALLVSELVSNSVRHAHTDGTVGLVEMEHGMHVDVSDESTDEPTMGRGGPGDESGRGIRLVDQLASTWGIVQRRGGKSVWFELRVALA